jgi:hypothetical protein
MIRGGFGPPSHLTTRTMRLFPLAFFSFMLGTLAVGYGLATETEYKLRECIANGNNPAMCELKHYGR